MHCFYAVLLLPVVVVAQSAASPEQVFDGQTLGGWRGDPAVWSVKDGCLVGSTVGAPLSANTFLILDARELADFELSAEVRLEGDNNSGIQYRSHELPGGGFHLAGPQCDVHRTPNYLGMLYDEQGAGIVARQGQFVCWRDAGPQVLGAIAKVRAVDLSAWHTLRVVARGELAWHEIDGRPVTAVQDLRAASRRRGLIGLQLHAGAPMTVWFRNVTLREYASVEAMAPHVPVPDAVAALLRREALRAQVPVGLVPQWLWDDKPGDGQELFLRRSFQLGQVPAAARLAVTCDNHCRVYVNGEKVAQGDAWESAVTADVAASLRPGENVIAVHGTNDGGPAGLVLRLSWQQGEQDQELVSDASWKCSGDDPDGWNGPGFDDAAWAPVRVLAALGAEGAPWSRALGEDALGTRARADAPQVAVVDTALEWPGLAEEKKQPGWVEPQVLELLSVPRSLGSWVSLGADDKGRLYASDQKAGLYRIVPATRAAELTTIERVPVELGGCHGLLWWRNALYAVVNGKGSGLYRLTDTDGDDVLDRVELLRALEGSGEHGPHSVVVAPDRENLLVLCGNQTKLPELAASRVPTNWAEDRLVPRLDDPNPYWEGHSPPGGFVCLVDPDGKRWELLCCGFRNPYDLVVLQNGDVMTYDADMEWDMGLPWYRPTRLLRVQSGVDYGWRIGSAKWPADYPDAPPAWADIGPGSPVGMIDVGRGHWLRGQVEQRVVALDWTFGTVYLGGKPFLTGSPLPLTDVAPARVADPPFDGVYLLTGGRGLPSTLLRVPIPPQTPSHDAVQAPFPDQLWPAEERRSPQEILATASEGYVAHARIALERLPVARWRDVVLAVDPAVPARALAGLHALARQGAHDDLQPLLDALGKLPFAQLAPLDRIAWLRVHALALMRLGPATDAQRAFVAARLLPLLPTGDERQDADLVELLAYVDAPGLLDKAVPLLAPLRPSPVPAWADVITRNATYGGVIESMLAAMPPMGQIAIGNALRTVPHGWTLDQRRTFFTFLEQARTRKGGSSYDGYLKKMIEAGWQTCTPAEQQQLAELVGKARADAPKFEAVPPKGPGRVWQLADAEAAVAQGLADRNLQSGHNLFHAIGCASCHYFAGEGGNHGPDLTSLGSKFAPRDVLESVLEPSKVISDQYSGSVLTRKDGTVLFGQVSKAFHGDTEVYEVLPATADATLVVVPVAEVAKVEPSKLSPMPANLLDRLSADELRDLMAFLLSRGQGLPQAR
ncbi:MAG TPA: family 16 glycoside hydrolase [Planctomycetota bacterium]|nr:family 16 glycoside hydrolase [Planctomycetota bacterium]